MREPPFVSYAQNGEDVVLWRALRHVSAGTYVEIGANHPEDDSATRAFYDRGWSGLTVEPVAAFAALHRESRPRDTLVQAAVTDQEGAVTLHVIAGSGLSTLVDGVSDEHARHGILHEDVTVPGVRLDTILGREGLMGREIHFLLVDVEGAEADVLATVDLRTWRPWVLVIESTAPNSTTPSHMEWEPEVLAAGYEFCLFDGVSRFYVASERAAELGGNLSYPACVLDGYVTRSMARLEEARAAALADAVHWRTIALTGWADAVTAAATAPPVDDRLDEAVAELVALRQTLSWRVTRPLRGLRRLAGRVRTAR